MDEAQIESIVDELRYYIDLDFEEKSNREIILEHIDEVIEYCDRYLVAEFLTDTYIPQEKKTDENLYQIYKDFRKDKIIPLDIKWEEDAR